MVTFLTLVSMTLSGLTESTKGHCSFIIGPEQQTVQSDGDIIT